MLQNILRALRRMFKRKHNRLYSRLRVRLNIRRVASYVKCFVTFKHCLIYTQTIFAHPLPCKGRAETVCVYNLSDI